MRCKNIDITFSIPVRVNEPDENGVIYTEEAINKACETATNAPIIQYSDKGEEVVIGVAHEANYSNGFIWVEGTLWNGGTEEFISFKDKKVASMKILSFGLTQ